MEDKENKVARNTVNNSGRNAAMSGGCMSNPMYRNIHNKGNYQPISGRGKRRIWDKENGLTSSKQKKFWELWPMPFSKEKQVIQLTIKSEYPLSLNIRHFRDFLQEYGYEVVSIRGVGKKHAQ